MYLQIYFYSCFCLFLWIKNKENKKGSRRLQKGCLCEVSVLLIFLQNIQVQRFIHFFAPGPINHLYQTVSNPSQFTAQRVNIFLLRDLLVSLLFHTWWVCVFSLFLNFVSSNWPFSKSQKKGLGRPTIIFACNR